MGELTLHRVRLVEIRYRPSQTFKFPDVKKSGGEMAI